MDNKIYFFRPWIIRQLSKFMAWIELDNNQSINKKLFFFLSIWEICWGRNIKINIVTDCNEKIVWVTNFLKFINYLSICVMTRSSFISFLLALLSFYVDSCFSDRIKYLLTIQTKSNKIQQQIINKNQIDIASNKYHTFIIY